MPGKLLSVCTGSQTYTWSPTEILYFGATRLSLAFIDYFEFFFIFFSSKGVIYYSNIFVLWVYKLCVCCPPSPASEHPWTDSKETLSLCETFSWMTDIKVLWRWCVSEESLCSASAASQPVNVIKHFSYLSNWPLTSHNWSLSSGVSLETFCSSNFFFHLWSHGLDLPSMILRFRYLFWLIKHQRSFQFPACWRVEMMSMCFHPTYEKCSGK